MDANDNMENGYMLKPKDHGVRNADLTDEDFVCIDVSGSRFITLKRTLERFPLTLLGDTQRREEHYVKCREAYFFDRCSKSFAAILHYYQSGGILIRPPSITMGMFCEEIAFFDLGNDVKLKLKVKEGYLDVYEDIQLPDKKWQKIIWNFFESPESSIWAKVCAVWSILAIVVSVVVFCLETVPSLNYKRINVNGTREFNDRSVFDEHKPVSINEKIWYYLELVCIIWFTIEYVLRLIASPSKWKFLIGFMNIIDLVAILPYYISLAISSGNSTTPFSVLRVVRLIRVFRVFKLSRYSSGLQVLGQALKASVAELGMLVSFLMLGVILFSSAIYYAEDGTKDTVFLSIPETFWYTLVTMTTVGYGDMTPKTLVGKLLGSLCTIVGVLTIALPVPVIASNFAVYYKRDMDDRENESSTTELRQNQEGSLLHEDEL